MKLVTHWTKLQDKANERLAICKECEYFNHDNSRCKVCGCFMEAKARWPYSECPIGKWKSYKKENKDG